MIGSRLQGARVFHPQLRLASRLLPPVAAGRRSLPLLRGLMRRIPAGPGFVEQQVSPTAAIRVYRPPNLEESAPAVLWLHGGGYIMGSPHQDELVLTSIADELGVIVASARYRLAPEDPFPAGLEDCYAALTWLAQQEDVDSSRVAIGGASAGGGLAAAVALAARERGGPKLCLQVLAYPMLDDRTAARPDPQREYRRLWSNESNRFAWSAYLGQEPGSDGISPLAAPARNEDLAGLPPAWIGIGDLDLFYDECLAYAAGLQDAGAECQTYVVPGAFHGFDGIGQGKPVSDDWRREQVSALRAAFAVNRH